MTSHNEIHRTEHDVVVVGARCAGAATAMLLARQGHDVVVVDRATFPSDTLSTHAIARGGVVQLARWGLLDAVVASGTPAISNVSFHFGDARVDREIRCSAGVDHLIAPRRHVLDTMLVEAAAHAGADVHTGVSVTGVTRDLSGRVTGITAHDADGHQHEVRGRVVVGADGVRSRIARSVQAPIIDERPSDGGCAYAYVAGLDATGFELHVGDDSYAGVFPTHGGEANVWVCRPAALLELGTGYREEAFLAALAATSPSLGERVRNAEVTSVVRSALRFPNHVRQAAGPGWALVGDAGYHRDPITGHGITDAFRDAELLARRLDQVLTGASDESTALSAYGEERYEALGPIFEVTCRLSQYPPIDEFVDLQMQLSRLMDEEARRLASLPSIEASTQLVAA